MKGKYIALIVAGSIMLAGAGMAVGAMAMSSFNFDKIMSVGEEKMLERTVEINERFSDINIKNVSVTIEPAGSDKASVYITELEKYKIDAKVENDALSIVGNDTRKWYDYIFSVNWPKAILYLPEKEYGELTADNNSDSVKVEDGLKFEEATIDVSSGSVKFDSDVAGDLKIKATSGSIKVNGVSAANIEAYATSGSVKATDINTADLDLTATSGSVTLSGTKASEVTAYAKSGSVRLDGVSVEENISTKATSGSIHYENVIAGGNILAETTSGSVRLEECDGANLDLKTTSGSIHALLLSGKEITANTSSGSIRLPEENVEKNGKLNAEATSGSITIKVK
ncbi:MAG: DUF4097 domain-containing protein [Lachnospiraceae bacterium]|nr:DUF4097 domain-containing protein [Lachnospiraceae bacterium]